MSLQRETEQNICINTSDIILVGLQDDQDNKADIILRYNADEARRHMMSIPSMLNSIKPIHLVLEIYT